MECPFCKSTNIATIDTNLGDILKNPLAYTRCITCGAVGPTADSARGARNWWASLKERLEYKTAGIFVAMKACIFCGELNNLKIKNTFNKGYFVECQRCKINSPFAKTPFEAVNIWNEAKP